MISCCVAHYFPDQTLLKFHKPAGNKTIDKSLKSIFGAFLDQGKIFCHSKQNL